MDINKLITLMVTLFAAISCEALLHHLSSETDSNTSLSQCVLEISKKFFPHYVTTVSYTYSPHENFYPDTQSNLMISKLMEESRWVLSVKTLNANQQVPQFEETAHGNIMMTKSYSDLTEFLRRRFDNIIVILQEHFENINKAVKQASKILWENNVTNALILLQDTKNATIYKVYIFAARCRTYKRFSVDRCSSGFLESDKKRFFKNCTLKAHYKRLRPFVINPNHDEHMVKHNGIEVNLLNAAASALNLKLLYKESTGIPLLIENGTLLGDYKLLYNGLIDFILGECSLTPERLKYFQPGPTYIQCRYTHCVPHRLVNDDLSHIANIFSSQVWCCIILTYLSMTCGVWYFSNYYTKESTSCKNFLNCLLDNFAMLIGLPAHVLPRTVKVRLLIALCTILGFQLNQIYSSYLTSILTSPNYKEKYSSMSEIQRDNLHVYTRNNFLQYLLNKKFKSRFDELTSKIEHCEESKKCLRSVSVYGNSTTVLKELEVKYQLKTGKIEKSSIHCMDLDSIYVPITVYMRKGFPFAEAFNNVIYRIISAGLLIKWTKEVTEESNTNLKGDEQNYIRFENLKPLLEIFVWSYGTCVLVFITELIVGHRRKIYWSELLHRC